MIITNLSEVARGYCNQNSLTFQGAVGTGAFKETFHVTDKHENSLALKVYKPGFSAERTVREIDAMGRCSHENIAQFVSLQTFIWGSEEFSIVTEEYLAGGTLAERLAAGLLSTEQLRALARPLVEALGHIASLELVHRDLKPDNILFRADKVMPVIVDFGLVRDLRAVSLTQSWAMRGPGTPLFSPPEQLLNEKNMIDWRSDQFSLGVLLSYAAFGVHPYEQAGDRPQNIIERVANKTEVPRSFVEMCANSQLESLVRMSAPWPIQRFRKPALLAASWA